MLDFGSQLAASKNGWRSLPPMPTLSGELAMSCHFSNLGPARLRMLPSVAYRHIAYAPLLKMTPQGCRLANNSEYRRPIEVATLLPRSNGHRPSAQRRSPLPAQSA